MHLIHLPILSQARRSGLSITLCRNPSKSFSCHFLDVIQSSEERIFPQEIDTSVGASQRHLQSISISPSPDIRPHTLNMPYNWTAQSERQMLLTAITEADLKPTQKTWAMVAEILGQGLTSSAVGSANHPRFLFIPHLLLSSSGLCLSTRAWSFSFRV